MLDKGGPEIRLGAEACSFRNLIDLHIPLYQQLSGLFQTAYLDRLVRSQVGDGTDFPVQSRAAQVHQVCDHIIILGWIADMLVDELVQLFQKTFVRFGIGHRVHIRYRRVEIEFAYIGAGGDQIGNLRHQQVGGEGFVQVSVGS